MELFDYTQGSSNSKVSQVFISFQLHATYAQILNEILVCLVETKTMEERDNMFNEETM